MEPQLTNFDIPGVIPPSASMDVSAFKAQLQLMKSRPPLPPECSLVAAILEDREDRDVTSVSNPGDQECLGVNLPSASRPFTPVSKEAEAELIAALIKAGILLR